MLCNEGKDAAAITQMKTEKLHNTFTDIAVCLAAMCIYIQSVTGGTDQTSGECSLGHTIPI